MNKKIVLAAIFVFLIAVSALEIRLVTKGGRERENGNELRIVASFYPMYIAALNIADGIDGVSVSSLTENQTGCLHDYQLTTQDMKKLEQADIFILNGGGMEGFIEEVISSYPELVIINAGEGIPLLEESGHTHEEQSDTENAHMWMNPEYYAIQVSNISSGLSKADSGHAFLYQTNESRYEKQIEDLKREMNGEWIKMLPERVIIFHEAYAYLADYLGITVAMETELEGESGIGTKQMADMIEEIRGENVSILFAEPMYSKRIVESLAKETKAVPVMLDPLVTGSPDKASYINGMKNNIRILQSVGRKHE